MHSQPFCSGWLGSRLVSVLDHGHLDYLRNYGRGWTQAQKGPGSNRSRDAVLGKLAHTRRASVHHAAKLVAAVLIRVARVTAGLAESNGAAYRRVYDSRHLQADCAISSGTVRSAVEYGTVYLLLPVATASCYAIFSVAAALMHAGVACSSSAVRLLYTRTVAWLLRLLT